MSFALIYTQEMYIDNSISLFIHADNTIYLWCIIESVSINVERVSLTDMIYNQVVLSILNRELHALPLS